jgi:hypothetical protein
MAFVEREVNSLYSTAMRRTSPGTEIAAERIGWRLLAVAAILLILFGLFGWL